MFTSTRRVPGLRRPGMRALLGRTRSVGHLLRPATMSELQINGFVGIDGVGAADVQQWAKSKHSSRLVLDSGGGTLRTGVAIGDLVERHQVPVHTVRAISAAAIVAIAGPCRSIASDGFIGVHPAWMAVAGGSAEFEAAAKSLRATDDLLARQISERSNLSPEQARNAIRAGKRWTADEAIASGLADQIGPPAGLQSPPDCIEDGPERECFVLRRAAEAHRHRANLERKVDSKSAGAVDLLQNAGAFGVEAFAPPARIAATLEHAAGDAYRRALDPQLNPTPPRWQCLRCGRLNFTPPAVAHRATVCSHCHHKGAKPQ